VDKWARPRASGTWVDGPLSTPPDDAEMLRYRASLAQVRKFTTARARRAGLPPRRVTDLVIAVAELAANTLVHTSGPGTLTLWITDDAVICQVQDQGQITDPHAGMIRPAPDAPGGGRGLGSCIKSAIESRSAPGRLAPQCGCICGAVPGQPEAQPAARRICGPCR